LKAQVTLLVNLTLFVAVPDEDAMKNAENVRNNFNLIMYKLA